MFVHVKCVIFKQLLFTHVEMTGGKIKSKTFATLQPTMWTVDLTVTTYTNQSCNISEVTQYVCINVQWLFITHHSIYTYNFFLLFYVIYFLNKKLIRR